MADPGRVGALNAWPDEQASSGRLRSWRWAWLGGGGLALVAACSAVLAPLGAPGHERSSDASRTAALPAPVLRGDVRAPLGPDDVVPGLPFLRTTGEGAEGRLIAAYAALGEGRGREAFELATALVHDHPTFALAQMLYGDLLATRAGWPAAFGVDAGSSADTQDPRRQGLRLEAQRRIAALRDRPPTGMVPAEFVRLAPGIHHAVAVDASRSRLYVFSNGPDGMRLERDFYVSLGKQGVDKRAEGDRRTPLGVYWVTAALPKAQLDARFGHGALRFNYPNAADRLQGRTGSGLFLHGVPAETLNHEPWATDGCVAMSNTDVEQLLQTLDVDATPVVIAQSIRWVSADAARQTAAEFLPAWQAWSSARREADDQETARWYLPGATEARRWKPAADDARERVSLLSWSTDSTPVMVVTSHAAAGPAPATYRQYWTRSNNQWRIAFEGPVAVTPTDNHAAARQAALTGALELSGDVATTESPAPASAAADRKARTRTPVERRAAKPRAAVERAVSAQPARPEGPTTDS